MCRVLHAQHQGSGLSLVVAPSIRVRLRHEALCPCWWLIRGPTHKVREQLLALRVQVPRPCALARCELAQPIGVSVLVVVVVVEKLVV